MKTYQQLVSSADFQMHGHPIQSMSGSFAAICNIAEDAPSDRYGTGAVINDFENQISELLGKESAIFFPSGTMAQQIAMRIACDRKKLAKVAFHPFCHLQIHEQQGLQELHNIEGYLIGAENRLFDLQDLAKLEEVSAVLFELPQREIGGQLPSWDALVEMCNWCKHQGIHTHLDGARLFEVLPFYEKSAAQVCTLFDSVYISFYKGLGGVCGAMLAASTPFMDQARIWKRRHGGDLYHLYPYVLTAKHALALRGSRMANYWEFAKAFAKRLNMIAGITTLPLIPQCNMFHVRFTIEYQELQQALAQVINKHNLALLPVFRQYHSGEYYIEYWAGDNCSQVDTDLLNDAMTSLASELTPLIIAQ
ncbi:MAG: beta-eliminating lyase-related protein [Oceanospirillaceae bacterium]